MSTKYLSSFIDSLPAGPTSNGFRDRFTPQLAQNHAAAEELKQILLDAKEGLEVKNTTHEFYETLERITNELRGMTEHSTAFLSRVRKSDAPDYFNIIKNPMDLGTVLKKVKAQQYKDKSSFKADLDLIWDNCLLYNTLPNHPLRRSAMTLRSRANHLLEFVTDPVASTPAPMVTHSQTASRFDKPGSRLDALDASHVVISTANLLGEPVGFAGRRNGHETTANGKQDQGTAEVKHEDGDGSSMADDDDFQDVEEDEEDESIRTRKGVTSHKTQPGGGRNLDLLKGLAAADPSADSPSGADDSLSIYPSGIDSKDDMSASRRSMDRSSGTPATPSTVPKSVNDLSDLISGALPGEGSALVARRAAADSLSMHSRRAKSQTPSFPPLPPRIPFAQWRALQRTPELMGQFALLSDTPDDSLSGLEDTTHSASRTLSDVNHHGSLPTLIASTLHNDFTPVAGTSGQSSPSSQMTGCTPISQPESDVAWWQTVCSDALLANGLPEVPAVACRPRPSTRKQFKDHAQGASNPCWSDIAHLKHVKRTHRKLGVLRRELPGFSTGMEYEDEDPTSDEEAARRSESSHAINPKRRALRKLGSTDTSAITGSAGRTAVQLLCATMLEHAGFDSTQQCALDNISNLTSQYLLSVGRAAAFQRDQADSRSLEAVLKRALHDVAADDTFPAGRPPLAVLAHYKTRDIPEYSEKLASLRSRLDATHAREIDEAERQEARLRLKKDIQDLGSLAGEDDTLPDAEDAASSYALLRMLLEANADSFGLAELDIAKDSGFPLHLLHSSLLRQMFPSTSGDLLYPFNPPPAYVSLAPLVPTQPGKGATKSMIGLLQPFLEARASSPYDLYDDDDLSPALSEEVRKSLATRPDVPFMTGRVTLGKRKREVPALAVGVGPINGLNISTATKSNTLQTVKSDSVTEKPKKSNKVQ